MHLSPSTVFPSLTNGSEVLGQNSRQCTSCTSLWNSIGEMEYIPKDIPSTGNLMMFV